MRATEISRSETLPLLRDLIRIPSVNPQLAPEERTNESAIADFARQWFESHGIRARLDEVAPNRPNMVAEVGSGRGPTLVFCGHLDTVSTSGMSIDPFEPKVESGRVYGRGSYDMKGGVAAAMIAAAALAKEMIAGRLIVALVADEEYASLGTQHFVKHYNADACILTEPSEGELILAHKGFVWLEVTCKGRAAHGSRFDLGVSAIEKMAKIIVKLAQFDRGQLRQRRHPLVGPASQHCAVIRGGTGLSTYSETCTLHLERRTLPTESLEGVVKEIQEVMASSGEEAEVRVLLERPPLACDREARVTECLREAARTVTGQLPKELGVAYWMDAALFAGAGVPTANYGAAGAGAHEAVEWVDLESVDRCAHVLHEAARLFFKD
jgi:acetylornithine deacetylase